MKRVALLFFLVVLAMAQKASADSISIGPCNDYAWADFTISAGDYKSTFVGVRLSDGKKVVVTHQGTCPDPTCSYIDYAYVPGVLWKNHILIPVSTWWTHEGGC